MRIPPHEAGQHDGGHGRHGGRGGPAGPGPRGRFREPDPAPITHEGLAAWLAGRLPEEWFIAPVGFEVDRDEITVFGEISTPAAAKGATPEITAEAEAGRITRFREDTREQRITIAREAEARYGRRVAWGISAGSTSELFTNASVPVMTRLRQPERQVLDTLVDAGVARSRSDALAWCVRLVGRNSDEWLGQLRSAMEAVEQARAQGPTA